MNSDLKKNKTIPGMLGYLQRRGRQLLNTPLSVAVTGCPGVGKSSFINGIRNMKSKDELAAPVGLNCSISQPMKYTFPNDDGVILLDLPGIGSMDYPTHTYTDLVGYRNYDCYIIVSSERFREEDSMLAKEAVKQSKSFFYVRSKFDQDLSSTKENNNDPNYPEAKLRKEMVSHIVKSMSSQDIPIGELDVFVTNNRKPEDFDLKLLRSLLLGKRDELKQESVGNVLRTECLHMVNERQAFMKKLVYIAALIAVIANIFDMKGSGMAVTIGILMTVPYIFRRMFDLRSSTLSTIFSNYGYILSTNNDPVKTWKRILAYLICFTSAGISYSYRGQGGLMTSPATLLGICCLLTDSLSTLTRKALSGLMSCIPQLLTG